MMIIEVRLFATLRKGRWKKKRMEYSEGITPREIIEDIKIDEQDIALLLINGKDASLNTGLKDNDVLSIFPPVGGG